MTAEDARDVASAIFQNQRFAEVVLVLDQEPMPQTAQQIARALGVNHDIAKKVLVRLERARLVKPTDRTTGGSRGALPYQVEPGEEWRDLVQLCRRISTH